MHLPIPYRAHIDEMPPRYLGRVLTAEEGLPSAENQSVVCWGFRTTDCDEDDPTVWQRNNTPPHAWYSEDKPFTRFLTSIFDWYRDMGMLRR